MSSFIGQDQFEKIKYKKKMKIYKHKKLKPERDGHERDTQPMRGA